MSRGSGGRGSGGHGASDGYRRSRRRRKITFSRREIRDLLVAWAALGVAFAVFFGHLETSIRPISQWILTETGAFISLLIVSLLTAGIGFLLHELAHKVMAIRYGQVAAFKASYGMLVMAVLVSFAGFIFAAPGAVYHRGRITERQGGLIALAGPVTNLALAIPFFFVFVMAYGIESQLLYQIGRYGVAINLLLAGFNMLPFGPLDGATIKQWDGQVWALVAIPSIVLGILSIFLI